MKTEQRQLLDSCNGAEARRMSMTRVSAPRSGRRSLTALRSEGFLWSFSGYGYRPDKTQQFAADCRDNLEFVFSSSFEFFVFGVETPLSLPGDVFGRLR